MVILVGGPALPLFEEWVVKPLPYTLRDYDIHSWAVTRDLSHANLYESEFKFKLKFKISMMNSDRSDVQFLSRTRKINIQEECRHGTIRNLSENHENLSEDMLNISTNLTKIDNAIGCHIRIDKIPFAIGPTIMQGVHGDSILN